MCERERDRSGTNCVVSVSMGTAWDFWTITGSRGSCLVTDAHTRMYICSRKRIHTPNRLSSYLLGLALFPRHRSISLIAAADVTCSYFRMFVKLGNSESRCAQVCFSVVSYSFTYTLKSHHSPMAYSCCWCISADEEGVGWKRCWLNCTTRGQHLGRDCKTQARECTLI